MSNMGKQTFKEQFEAFLKQIKQQADKYQLIEPLIENNLKYSKPLDVETNIEEALLNFFGANPSVFFDYMKYHIIFDINQLDLNHSEYKKVLEAINVIKIKYGAILEDMVIKNKNPFMIAGFQTNVRGGETTHLLKIIRNDGETFDTNFKPAVMLQLLPGLISSVRMSMEKGVYNVSQDVLDRYLTESDGMKQFLIDLMASSKHE